MILFAYDNMQYSQTWKKCKQSGRGSHTCLGHRAFCRFAETVFRARFFPRWIVGPASETWRLPPNKISGEKLNIPTHVRQAMVTVRTAKKNTALCILIMCIPDRIIPWIHMTTKSKMSSAKFTRESSRDVCLQRSSVLKLKRK